MTPGNPKIPADWTILIEVLREMDMPIEVMTYPERFPDQISCAKRGVAIRKIRKLGVSVGYLTTVTPYSESGIRWILRHGDTNNRIGFRDNGHGPTPESGTVQDRRSVI